MRNVNGQEGSVRENILGLNRLQISTELLQQSRELRSEL